MHISLIIDGFFEASQTIISGFGYNLDILIRVIKIGIEKVLELDEFL